MTTIEESLSPAERDVLQKLLNGLRNQEIASKLRLSDKTVKNHISHILRKTGTTSRLELTIKVYKQRERALRRRFSTT
ncbi:MAG TPA: LuxR C-terminal-related transcriptional regulator [Candidatus Baltobacteraceae bacterium]|nr:LuxR C-terminal-related transcriptional regulator [Candidatus Baltobacteraceae bacterium]